MLVNSIFEQTEIDALPEEWNVVCLEAQIAATRYEEVLQRHGTRMTQIERIFTDIFNPCVSVSPVQSVFYRDSAIINEDKKPQINADERRYLYVMDFSKTTHRKGCKERKAVQQESLRPLRSLRLNVFFTPAHECAPMQPALYARLSRAGDKRGWREDGGD